MPDNLMLTPEEAAEKLSDYLDYLKRAPADLAIWIPMKSAIDALRKQIPVKMDEVHFDLWICPVCEDNIYGIQGKYCPNCGQALAWGE